MMLSCIFVLLCRFSPVCVFQASGFGLFFWRGGAGCVCVLVCLVLCLFCGVFLFVGFVCVFFFPSNKLSDY